jgi:hypothetical protein
MALFLVCFSVVTQAGDCKPYDIRKNSGLGEIRDQGKKPWCFVFAAADLLGAATKVEASPLALLIEQNYQQYYLNSNKLTHNPESLLTLEGADIVRTVNNVAQIGFCPQFRYPDERRIGYAENVKLLKMVSRDHEHLPTVINSVRYCGGGRQQFGFVATRIPIDKLQLTLAEQVLDRTVTEELKSNRAVALHMNVDVFDRAAGTPVRSGNHAALVVARKKNADTGVCEYTIRNSWGLLDSADKTSYPYFDKGHLVVSERELIASLFGMTILSPKTTAEKAEFFRMFPYPHLK